MSNILGDLQELAAQYRDNIGQCPYCKKSIPAICDCCMAWFMSSGPPPPGPFPDCGPDTIESDLVCREFAYCDD